MLQFVEMKIREINNFKTTTATSALHQPTTANIHQHLPPTNSNYNPNPTHENKNSCKANSINLMMKMKMTYSDCRRLLRKIPDFNSSNVRSDGASGNRLSCKMKKTFYYCMSVL